MKSISDIEDETVREKMFPIHINHSLHHMVFFVIKEIRKEYRKLKSSNKQLMLLTAYFSGDFNPYIYIKN